MEEVFPVERLFYSPKSTTPVLMRYAVKTQIGTCKIRPFAVCRSGPA
jgi:hypothetical protein